MTPADLRLMVTPYAALIRVGLVVLAVLVVLLAGWRLQTWRSAYHRLQAMETALETCAAERDRYAAEAAAAQQVAAEAAARAHAKSAADKFTADRVERELKTKLAAADDRGRDLARRLLDATRSGGGPVPEAAAAPGESVAVRRDAERDAALGEVFASCQRDADRLTGWQEWWAEVGAR